MRVLPFPAFGLSARAIALIMAIAILILLGNRSLAEKVLAVVLAAGLLVSVILSIVIGIRRRQAFSKL